MPKPPSQGLRIRLVLGPDLRFGPGKADLLEGIAATGSIAAAGRRMGMSYKRAWMLVEAMNAGFATPLVETHRGGTAHGGATLSPLGADLLAAFRRLEAKAAAATEAEAAAIRAALKPAAN